MELIDWLHSCVFSTSTAVVLLQNECSQTHTQATRLHHRSFRDSHAFGSVHCTFEWQGHITMNRSHHSTNDENKHCHWVHRLSSAHRAYVSERRRRANSRKKAHRIESKHKAKWWRENCRRVHSPVDNVASLPEPVLLLPLLLTPDASDDCARANELNPTVLSSANAMNACTVTFHNVIGADAAVVAFVVAEHCRVRCCDLLLYCLHLLLLFSLRLPDTVVVRQPDVTSDTNILAPNFSVAAWSNQSPNIDNRCEPKIKIFFHTASVLLSLRLVARATRQQKKRPNTYRKDMMDAHTPSMVHIL